MKGNETIHVKRPGDVDWQGDPTGAPQEFDIPNCQLWPRLGPEDADRGRTIIEGWNLYIPPRSANTVYATDVVTVRGDDYIVDGVPGQFDLKGRDKGIIATLKKVGS